MFSRFVQNAVRKIVAVPSSSASASASSSLSASAAVVPSFRSTFSTEASTLTPGIGKGKTSTGIVGLPVDPDAVSNIIVSYQALLDRMASSELPETAQYRVDVEKIARYRIKVAMENPDDPEAVEDLCQCGQVEELIEQAKDEMEVLEMYLAERLWEYVDSDVVSGDDIDIEYNPDPSADEKGIEEENA